MACAADHARFNLIAVTAATVLVQRQQGQPVDGAALAMGAVAASLPSLPDWIEPALHPNHRKFFHSVTCVMGIVYAMRRAYAWQPTTQADRLIRLALLAAGAAYLGHLALDATTAKSLPLI
jgi:inner membrane protein